MALSMIKNEEMDGIHIWDRRKSISWSQMILPKSNGEIRLRSFIKVAEVIEIRDYKRCKTMFLRWVNSKNTIYLDQGKVYQWKRD